MAKNTRISGSFTPLPTVKHSDGWQFQQRGDRVYIEDEAGREVDTITSSKLQSAFPWEPVYLTTRELRTLAATWLADQEG